MKERKLPDNFWEDVLILEYSINSQTEDVPLDKLQQLIHLFCVRALTPGSHRIL